MGKKNLKKYKQKKNINQEDYKETTEEEMSKMIFKDAQSTVEKLKSPDLDTRNYITTILSTYQFNDTKEQSLRKIFTSPQVIFALSNLLNDNSYQIKYNAISSLSNIIISYSDTDIDKTLITQTNFSDLSINLIKDFTNVEKNTKEYIERVRTLKNLLDLYMLLIDMSEEDLSESKINFNKIIYELLVLLIKKTDFISEELFLHINKFLGTIFSAVVIQMATIKDNEFVNLFKTYIDNLNNLFNNKDTSNIKKSSVSYILFYVNLINFDYFKKININLLPGLIDYSFTELTKDNLLTNLNQFSEVINTIEKDKAKLDENEKKNEETNEDIKSQATIVYEEVESLYNCLKVFQEIITSVDIPTAEGVGNNENFINKDDYEDIDEDKDDNEIKNDLFDDIVHKTLNEVLSINNYEPLKKMLNQKIMNNLSYLCDIENKLGDYYINENDKILLIKEELGEIEYLSLSIINNIIVKYQKFITQEYLNSLYTFLGTKINTLMGNTETNEYFLSLVILTLRTLLDKYNGNFKNFQDNDYINLFNIIKKVKDNFIKCNVVDIITFCACVDNKFNVGGELKNLLFSENDIEVLSHVINAFMDIFKNDDLESNKYLKEIDIINLFSKGISEFKNKFKKAKKENNLEPESIDYCKDTFLNMKRFIKYKEDSFKQLKLI
jgi:hypothetical protein